MQKTVGRSEQQKEEEKDMAEDYRNQAILVLALGKVLVVVFRKMNLGAVNVESAK